MAEYKLRVRDASGTLLAEMGIEPGHSDPTRAGVRALVYRTRVNHAGYGEFVLPVNHALMDQITSNAIIEFWRRPPGGAWVMEFGGIWRSGRWRYDDNARQVTLRCVGFNDLLRWRHVAYTAGYANRSYFSSVAAETIAKTLVTYNITASATTTNGRLRDGTNYPATLMTVETDAGRGNVLQWYCAYDNLLATLIDLARVGGGDFSVGYGGSGLWQFKWHDGQLGSDVSSQVVFALGYANMQSLDYRISHEEEATVAIVGGQGKGPGREIEIVNGSGYGASNDIETFVAAPDVDLGDASALQERGQGALEQLQADERFDFRIVQTQGAQYGVDYALGDLVSVVNPFTSAQGTYKIVGVTVVVDERGERIDPELEAV